MATLSADKSRKFGITEGPRTHMPVVQADIIYRGAAVGDNGSGYARPLAGGDPFAGFAVAKADNSAGSNGTIDVEMSTEGTVELTVVGATGVGDKDEVVYAIDDDTFTLTATTSYSAIGKIERWVSGTTCVVRYQAASHRSI